MITILMSTMHTMNIILENRVFPVQSLSNLGDDMGIV